MCSDRLRELLVGLDFTEELKWHGVLYTSLHVQGIVFTSTTSVEDDLLSRSATRPVFLCLLRSLGTAWCVTCLWRFLLKSIATWLQLPDPPREWFQYSLLLVKGDLKGYRNIYIYRYRYKLITKCKNILEDILTRKKCDFPVCMRGHALLNKRSRPGRETDWFRAKINTRSFIFIFIYCVHVFFPPVCTWVLIFFFFSSLIRSLI